jgi:hypothetical protein
MSRFLLWAVIAGLLVALLSAWPGKAECKRCPIGFPCITSANCGISNGSCVCLRSTTFDQATCVDLG